MSDNTAVPLKDLLLQAVLDKITIDKKQPVTSYVRCRHTLDDVMPNRKSRRDAKMVVIAHLGGRKEGNHVLFPNGETKSKMASF